MDGLGWLQLLLFFSLLTLLMFPLGGYLYWVLDGKRGRLLSVIENSIFKLLCIDQSREHNWKQYFFALLLFSFFSALFTFLVIWFQAFLPLNPMHFKAPSWHLNFNIAVSFLTNTNWQSYSGERTLSYFSQMLGLTFQNFVSAAVGLCVAAALARGIALEKKETLGNFWVDLLRINIYLLVPLAVFLAVFFVAMGVPQNFNDYVPIHSVEGKTTLLTQGPIASQEAIKLLGTNGGGFTHASSSHPYENPSPLSNFSQMLVIILIPVFQIYYYGRRVNNIKHSLSMYIALILIFTAGLWICNHFERAGSPLFAKSKGIEAVGNMEGKEQRFGIFSSTLYTAVTTGVSCGSVNSQCGSYTPIGGLIPMLNIQLGEVVFGGVGAGLYSVIIFIILTVFITGLIIGRTPAYLGKRIEPIDVKLSVIAILVFTLAILGFTAWGCLSKEALSSVSSRGPHGFSEILYAFSSAAGNNGSAFGGLRADSLWYNVNTALAMLIGRFGVIACVLCLAGSFVKKSKHPLEGTFVIHGITFTLLLIAIIILVGVLTFIPAITMGPVLEEFFMQHGAIY